MRFFLNILYPPKCVFCGKILNKDGEDVCEDCSEEVMFLSEGEAASKGEFFDGCISAFPYKEKVRAAILRFKNKRCSHYAAPLAKMTAFVFKRDFGDIDKIDMITFVPTDGKTKFRRGYNQAELLAKEFAKELKLPPPKALMYEARKTEKQARLSAEKRKANLLGAIRAKKGAEIKGKNILVVDDIITTGSTLSECARALKTAGSGKVYCVTAAKTEKGAKKPLKK